MSQELLEVHCSIDFEPGYENYFNDPFLKGKLKDTVKNMGMKYTNLYNLGSDNVNIITFHLYKTPLTYLDITKRIGTLFRSSIYRPTRIKVEEMWWNQGVPEDPRYDFKPYEYFEIHLKIRPLNIHAFMDIYPTNNPDVKLSVNQSRAHPNDMFLTRRFNNCVKSDILGQIENIEDSLTGLDVAILEIEKEFISMDTKLAEDILWCPVTNLRILT